MAFHRHVGKIKSTSQRCLVVFRQVPEEQDRCLIVTTDQLPDRYHSDIINGVESVSAQNELEFATYAARTMMSTGENMLSWLHGQGRLKKMPTDDITMLPTPNQSISLTELNKHLDSIKKENVKTTDPVSPVTVPEQADTSGTGSALGDRQLAKNLLNQALTYEKEVNRLREQAYKVAPNLKPKEDKPKRAKKTPAKKAKE
ncbi:MAG: hypothetical protein CXT73_03945 [Methanobacteriota archaeon]|jgi:hypothetical protein|nr:MAG: hypothetical protein CXT73_03945 [Euryarchaeota archaeon]